MSTTSYNDEDLLPVLIRIEGYLRENEFPIAQKLMEGLSEDEISRQLQRIRLDLPRDLIQLYKWKNGTDVSNYLCGCADNIFSHGYLMSLEDSISNYLFMTDSDLLSRTFFPIVTNGGGDFLLYDFLDGQIYYYGPPVLVSPLPDSIYDSLFLMFKTIETGYTKHVYSVKDGNRLEINSTLEVDIAASLNPNSQFYKD